MLPVIILSKENPKEAVCQVFEKVNTGGVSLNVFELLTATFAADEFDLKKDYDFANFFSDRKEKILQRIEKAMNKSIPRGTMQTEEGIYLGADED